MFVVQLVAFLSVLLYEWTRVGVFVVGAGVVAGAEPQREQTTCCMCLHASLCCCPGFKRVLCRLCLHRQACVAVLICVLLCCMNARVCTQVAQQALGDGPIAQGISNVLGGFLQPAGYSGRLNVSVLQCWGEAGGFFCSAEWLAGWLAGAMNVVCCRLAVLPFCCWCSVSVVACAPHFFRSSLCLYNMCPATSHATGPQPFVCHCIRLQESSGYNDMSPEPSYSSGNAYAAPAVGQVSASQVGW